MHHLKRIGSLAAFLLFALFAAPLALAHETGEPHEEPAGIPAPMVKPLDIIKARAQQIKQNATEAKIELRADTKMQLKIASTSPEKRDIMKGAIKERIDITKERVASSTQLRKNVKEMVRQHGGLIKERFVNAIRGFNKMLERIDSRIEKMAAAGIDVSSVSSLKVEAEVAIDKAEVDTKAVADFVASVSDSSDRAAVKAELEAKIKTAQASIKAAHQALQKVVRALVALAKDTRPAVDASASAETTVELNN